MLIASEPQNISDSTPAPSPARPASPTQTPFPAASFSTAATPASVPTHTPSPSPPPSHTKVLALAWFPSNSARDTFLSRFINRSVHACEIANVDSIRAENLGFIEYLLQSHCEPLLDLNAKYYPQLIRMFYANVRTLKTTNWIFFECQVKYTKFTFSESDLNTIFGLPSVTQPHLSPLEIRNKLLSEFANPHNPADTHNLSYTILKRNPRLLYYVLIHTILPKPNFPTRITRKTLELLYLFLTSKSINFARYILSCMSKVSSILRLAPLPYANLLTHIFHHFGVSLTNEVFATKPVPIITPVIFTSILFLKTDHSGRKFVKDMTPDELLTVSQSSAPPIPPRVPSAQSPPPSSLLDQIHTSMSVYMSFKKQPTSLSTSWSSTLMYWTASLTTRPSWITASPAFRPCSLLTSLRN
ncbi:hypothetical protein Cgig2_030712 [Carnegiea gigantea]|uniref:Putative plant transposon protein domain-containing protein n=1 Tax=Carnegiea gigantea TaxID=171969 RepID=A0A9Q1K6E4_9CARY|nr:hypothetical protein Cgig2_030712 [Carnegiea gigantea]